MGPPGIALWGVISVPSPLSSCFDGFYVFFWLNLFVFGCLDDWISGFGLFGLFTIVMHTTCLWKFLTRLVGFS